MTDKRNFHSRPLRTRTGNSKYDTQPRRNREEKVENYRGEIYSRRLKNQDGNSYFLNLKENREADIYLNIVESRSLKPKVRRDFRQDYPAEHESKGAFERQSILIFAEQRQTFATECLAALEALQQGQSYRAEVESPQRQFNLQVRSQKQNGLMLSIREDSLHYGKPLQNQIQIPQSAASYFSQAFIEILEKWLDSEKQQSRVPPKTGRKKVRVLRSVSKSVNHAGHSSIGSQNQNNTDGRADFNDLEKLGASDSL